MIVGKLFAICNVSYNILAIDLPSKLNIRSNASRKIIEKIKTLYSNCTPTFSYSIQRERNQSQQLHGKGKHRNANTVICNIIQTCY